MGYLANRQPGCIDTTKGVSARQAARSLALLEKLRTFAF